MNPLQKYETSAIGIYIHWPFCTSKCPYCDFNSHVRQHIDHHAWCNALVAEIDYASHFMTHRMVSSIFFGGGTPSLMQPTTVAALIERIAYHWSMVSDVEITLEANPTSVEAATFRSFHHAGVNRLSLGIQALEDTALRLLGRTHSVAHARAALMLAATHVDRFSFDLIYTRPGQTPQAWENELTQALELVDDHLSVYQLTIEPGTLFHTLFHQGKLTLPDDETSTTLFEITQTLLGEKGLPAYEISNHSRPTAECRHNLLYWRYGDYVGIGPGAHGRVTLNGHKWATSNYRTPHVWLKHVQRHGHGREEAIPLSAGDCIQERLLMGLRLTEGVARRQVSIETTGDLLDWLDPTMLDHLIVDGFLQLTDTHLIATAKGRQCLNAVLTQLI